VAASKAKVSLRLERGDGDARVFWEITRERSVITTRFGRYLGAGRTLVKAHESPAAAARAYERAVAAKRREGYDAPYVRAEVGSASRKGVSARNPELEALIDEAPSDPERYLVYADWLQQQGDARGELSVIQHRLATSTDPEELGLLERDHAALLKKFEAELLGPLAKYVFLRSSVRSFRTFSWRCGFIRAARFSRLAYRFGQEGLHAALKRLFLHPSGRFLERIFVGGYEPGDAGSVFADLGSDGPPTLVALVVGDGAQDSHYIEPVWSEFPRLRALELAGRVDDFGGVIGSELQLLRVAWAEHIILASLARSSFPRLGNVHLTVPTRDSERYIVDLLGSDAAPALERLTVRRWMVAMRGDESYELVPQVRLATDVARAAASRNLARLDLEMPIGEEGATTLLAHASALGAIGDLRIPREGVSAVRRAALSSALPNLTWTAPPEEEELDLDEIDETPAAWKGGEDGRAPSKQPERRETGPAPLSSSAEPR